MDGVQSFFDVLSDWPVFTFLRLLDCALFDETDCCRLLAVPLLLTVDAAAASFLILLCLTVLLGRIWLISELDLREDV